MTNAFTNYLVLSIEGDKIFAPPEPGMVPYLAMDGSYWAASIAQTEDYDEVAELCYLGWEPVESALGIPLRELMRKPVSGKYQGKYDYWSIPGTEESWHRHDGGQFSRIFKIGLHFVEIGPKKA